VYSAYTMPGGAMKYSGCELYHAPSPRSPSSRGFMTQCHYLMAGIASIKDKHLTIDVHGVAPENGSSVWDNVRGNRREFLNLYLLTARRNGATGDTKRRIYMAERAGSPDPNNF